MFYCEDCRQKHNWPESFIMKSYGPCECCNKVGECNDFPSSLLPEFTKEEQTNEAKAEWKDAQ